jgi:phage terminase large subunit-like protein
MVQRFFPHYADCPSAWFHIELAIYVSKHLTCKAFCEWGRGLAKSVVSDILIPFWLWLKGEKVYMVIVGSSYDKAEQLLEDLRLEWENNPQIIKDFGEQKNPGSWEDGFYQTKNNFIAQALGLGQSCRGLRVGNLRPNYIVMDDCETKDTVKNERRQDEIVEWVEKYLLPTMDGQTRRFILANNAFAPIMIQKKLQERHPKWKVHHVKAYDPVTYKPAWPEKYSDTYFQEVEDEIGILAAQAEYNQEPHVEGKIFKDDQVQWCKLPRLDHFDAIVGHWDIAYAGTATADYNAVRIWGLKNKQFYYITSFVKKTKMRAALDFMADYQKNLPAGVRVHWRFESQFWNDEVERTIREAEDDHQIDLRITKVDTPRIRKYDRIVSLQPYYQNGRIWYNEKMKPHKDTQIGMAQLFGIEPNYKGHDDAPDADEQAITYLSKHIYTGTPGKAPLTGKVERKHLY